MSIYKTLETSDQFKRVFETNKNFRFNQNDSGSGIFVIKARDKSFRNYDTCSDEITTITSGSVSTNYYGLPTWNHINTRYYKYITQEDKPLVPYQSFDIRPHQSRSLHTSSSVFSITRDVIG